MFDVLLVLPAGGDSGPLQTALVPLGGRLHRATSLEEARTILDHRRVAVILFHRAVPREGWREAVALFAREPYRACVILLSPVVDAFLWEEMVRYGGYDVVAAGTSAGELANVVRRAWYYWRNTRAAAATPD